MLGYTVYGKLNNSYDFNYRLNENYHSKDAYSEEPKELYFAGERVPMEKKHVASRIEREVRLLASWKEGTARSLQRANYWLPIFEEIFKQYDVPPDFKYLAVIESNLSNVVSPMGAAGFWQLMPQAAAMAKLEINAEVDERFHPIKAAHAAALVLKNAHGYFHNWTYACASYNMGVGGMQSAVRANGGKSYYDMYLNAETARFIYKLLAVKQIFENPETHGIQVLPTNSYLPPFKSLQVKESIPNLLQFAQKHGLTLAQLKEYNPWLKANSLTVKPGKSYEILLPTTFPVWTESMASVPIEPDTLQLP